MIYWFTGKSGVGKTLLAQKLKELLQTEKRNWRRDVFLIDGDENYSVEHAQIISNFLISNNVDGIVSLTSPNLKQREIFKDECGENIIEIYVHRQKKSKKQQLENSNYTAPEVNYFDVDTTSDNVNQSFNKLVHFLRAANKI
jgi:adenylylsulfate kinase-like enzyme